MALHFETQIYAAVVELGKVVLPVIRNMHRDVKMLMGRMILDEVLWMGVLIMRINKAPGHERPPLIEGERQEAYGLDRWIKLVDRSHQEYEPKKQRIHKKAAA